MTAGLQTVRVKSLLYCTYEVVIKVIVLAKEAGLSHQQHPTIEQMQTDWTSPLAARKGVALWNVAPFPISKRCRSSLCKYIRCIKCFLVDPTVLGQTPSRRLSAAPVPG